MATLDEEIAELKATIKNYEAEYAAATTSEEKKLLLQAITASRETLNKLLSQQQSQYWFHFVQFYFILFFIMIIIIIIMFVCLFVDIGSLVTLVDKNAPLVSAGILSILLALFLFSLTFFFPYFSIWHIIHDEYFWWEARSE